jgi:hypothetical protein
MKDHQKSCASQLYNKQICSCRQTVQWINKWKQRHKKFQS